MKSRAIFAVAATALIWTLCPEADARVRGWHPNGASAVCPAPPLTIAFAGPGSGPQPPEIKPDLKGVLPRPRTPKVNTTQSTRQTTPAVGPRTSTPRPQTNTNTAPRRPAAEADTYIKDSPESERPQQPPKPPKTGDSAAKPVNEAGDKTDDDGLPWWAIAGGIAVVVVVLVRIFK